MANDLESVLERIARTFKTEFEPLEVDGRVYELLSIANMAEHLDKLVAANAIAKPLRDLPLWAKVWPGSIVLGRFLRKYEPQGKSLLELGCGVGTLSLIAANYGFAKIVASDIDDQALDFARAHVLKNGLQQLITVRQLDVAAQVTLPEQFEMIAASELLYLDNLHRPLLRFLKRNLKPGGKAFFCTDLARAKPHFQKLAAKEFEITEGKIGVKATDEAGGEQRRIYSILILEK